MAETDAALRTAPPSPERPRTKRPVFLTSAAITIAVTLWCALAPTHAEATLGEICDALRAEWGEYREPARF